MALIGWHLNYKILYDFFPGGAYIQYNTAICFIAVCLSLLLLSLKKRLFSGILGVFVFSMGFFTLIEFLFEIPVSIDRLFFNPQEADIIGVAGRMSEITSIGFSLLGISLLFLSIEKFRSKNWFAGVFCALIFAIAFASLTSYLFQQQESLGWNLYSRMSLPTALNFLLSSLAVFFLSFIITKEIFFLFRVYLPIMLFLLIALFLSWHALNINFLLSKKPISEKYYYFLLIYFFGSVSVIILFLGLKTKNIEQKLLKTGEKAKLSFRATKLNVFNWQLKDNYPFAGEANYAEDPDNPKMLPFEQWLEGISETDRDKVVQSIKAFLANPKSKNSFQFFDKDQKRHLLATYSLNVADDKEAEFLMVIQDTTEMFEKDDQLKKAFEIINALPNPLLAFNKNTFIELVNDAAKNFFTQSSETLIGKKLTELFPTIPPTHLDDLIHSLDKTNFTTSLTCIIPDEHKIKKYYLLTLMLINGLHSTEPYYFLWLEDQTVSVTSERQEKRLSKLREDLITIVSHQIRDPLTVIKESLSICLESLQKNQPDQLHTFLEKAAKNTEKINQFVHKTFDAQMLAHDYLKLHLSPVNLNDLCQKVVENFLKIADQKGLTLNFEKDSTLPTLKLDERKLTDVLNNLVDNALNFTKEGSVTLRIKNEEKHLYIEVQDHGPGISKEYERCIFEPFSEGHQEHVYFGSGLGLFICKKYIELHEGTLDFHSEVGQGSTFFFRIPKYEG